MAVDGESVTVDGEHRYVMLCASDGSYALNPHGIPTHDCLAFLLDVKARNPRKRFVAFGLNYDVNMMLRDLAEPELKRLWDTGRIVLTLPDGIDYRIEWIPAKSFSVARDHERKYVRVFDTFGFFQTSFVVALEKWGIPDPNGTIARMKAERAFFTLDDMEEMRGYCIAECELLTELCNRLEDSLSGADLHPSSWHGAGAVAAALLRSMGVKSHRVPDSDFPEPVREAIMHAYFGGRTEVFLQGVLRNVVNYDLRSAYPSEALHLPSLVGGEWRHECEYDPSARHALWRVRWNVPAKFSVMPFPVRKKGAIYYPENGCGWYHAKEVRRAWELYAEYMEVEEGWIFTPSTDSRPFAWIRNIYELRQIMQAEGKASEKAYKLGLNSVYGKLAQGYGFRGSPPPFQSFFWAGAITAGTRARLLELAALNLSGVVSMATDGIVFSGDPQLEESTNLGGLERTDYAEIFIAQPGIYRAVLSDGTVIRRSRGFFTREIDYEDLHRGWLREGPHYQQEGVCRCGHAHAGACSYCDCATFDPPTRFIGLGSALMRTDMSVWRSWVPSGRTLNLYSSRKFYDPLVHRSRVMRLFPPRVPEGTVSEKYTPKGRGLDVADYVAGLEQPMQTF